MPQMQVRTNPHQRLTVGRRQPLLVLPISIGSVSEILGPDVRFSSPSSSLLRFLGGVPQRMRLPLHLVPQETECIRKRDGSASV